MIRLLDLQATPRDRIESGDKRLEDIRSLLTVLPRGPGVSDFGFDVETSLSQLFFFDRHFITPNEILKEAKSNGHRLFPKFVLYISELARGSKGDMLGTEIGVVDGGASTEDMINLQKFASAGFKCATCGISKLKLLRCSRCCVVYYCDRECQRVGWKSGGHKKECVESATNAKSAKNTE
jgi:hypothetical protein